MRVRVDIRSLRRCWMLDTVEGAQCQWPVMIYANVKFCRHTLLSRYSLYYVGFISLYTTQTKKLSEDRTILYSIYIQ